MLESYTKTRRNRMSDSMKYATDKETLEEIVNVFDPFFKRVLKLTRIRRYALWNVIHDDDVGVHTYKMASIAMIMADYYNKDKDESKKVNIEILLRKALLHDLEESENGDIPFPLKNSSKDAKEFFNKVEEETIYNKMFLHMTEYRKYAAECKEGLEGVFITIADMFDIILFTMAEMSIGNETMKPLFLRACDFVNDVSIKFEKQFDIELSFIRVLLRVMHAKVMMEQHLIDIVVDGEEKVNGL